MGQVQGMPNPPPRQPPQPPRHFQRPRYLGARVRRQRYTRADKQHALLLIDRGQTYRAAARAIAPNCSAGTVLRWVRERQVRLERERIQEAYRLQLEERAREMQAQAEAQRVQPQPVAQ